MSWINDPFSWLKLIRLKKSKSLKLQLTTFTLTSPAKSTKPKKHHHRKERRKERKKRVKASWKMGYRDWWTLFEIVTVACEILLRANSLHYKGSQFLPRLLSNTTHGNLSTIFKIPREKNVDITKPPQPSEKDRVVL